MLKAEQGKVIQDSNMFVLNKIRALEIDFYSSWYMAFGNQALVIAGFALESYSQVVPPTSTPFELAIANIYWLSIVFCFSTCAHCSIVCVFSYIYGNGLALRGPAGSVVKAVKGMAADRFEVFNSYAFGVLMLILSTVTTYFIVMNFLMAVVSSVLNVLGGIYTYRTCLNIYNRFKLIGGSESKLPFSHKDDRHELDSGSEDEFEDIDDNRTRLVGPVRKNSGGMLGKFFSFGGRRKRNSLKKDKHASGNDMDGFERVSRVNNKVRAKGFMSMRKDDRSKWKRYYFVMVRSNMYYYKSQSDWELSRTNSVKSRPIDLEGYIVSGVSVEPPYQIVISPAAEDDNRKIWEFRCDTVHEMDAWIQGFNLSSRVQAVPGPTNIEDMDLFDPTGVDGNYDKTNDNVWANRNEESSEPATGDRGTVGSSSSVNSFYDVNTENSVTSFRSFNQ